MGKRELKRLLKIKDEIQKKQGVKDIDEYVMNEKSYKFTSEKEVLRELHNLRERTKKETDKYFHDNKIGKYEIKTVPSSFNQHFAFYMSGDLENKKKRNVFYKY